ncbi:hypothetical protein MASR2M48_16390 [Spirochaetota bacterium]
MYIGDLDTLLQPFIRDEAEARKAIGLFLLGIDRTINDSFCHADIGPEATTAGRLILELTREQKNAVPNISLKYDPERTSDEFAMLAASSASGRGQAKLLQTTPSSGEILRLWASTTTP